MMALSSALFTHVRRIAHILSFLSLLQQPGHASQYHDEPEKVFHFLSRPEIRAPRWNITTHRSDLISPGYWFLAPYETLATHSEFNGYGWVGPHIYDASNGELIWSGTGEFDGANVLDFRINNVAGEDMITLTDRDQGTGIIVDDKFEIRDVVEMEDSPGQINGHEFHFVDNGTRVLIMKNHRKPATAEASKRIGFRGDGDNNECIVNFNAFVELDAVTFEQKFSWDSYDFVHIEESTYREGVPNHFCTHGGLGWDFIHANSVDKNEEGDYILSGRHTNTLYKISGKDGSIVWRLEGYQNHSDFEMIDLKFSRQHHVRWRGRNETHRFVSFLDNAWGQDKQKPSHVHSRGLLVALDEENMVATIEREYDHPNGRGGFARKRGNLQVLPNGNVFMGWSNQGFQSEHTADGELIYEAILQTEWLGSYRNYKFPFVGRPATLPAVHAAAYGATNDSVETLVHVSWNGATEVAAWNVYRSTSAGEHSQLVASANTTGFETRIAYDGYASYVYVEAVDRDGEALAWTNLHKTITHPNVTALAIESEQEWLSEAEADLAPLAFGNPTIMFAIGVMVGVILVGVAWLIMSRRGRRSTRYQPVVEDKFEVGEDDGGDETMVAEEESFYDPDHELKKGKGIEIEEVGGEKERLWKGDHNVP